MAPTNAPGSKPYTLALEHRPEYLHILIESEHLDLAAAKDLVREAAVALKSAGHTRILAEIRVAKRLSAADRYLVISEFPDLGFGQYRIALLYPDSDDPDEYQFSEAVMANRGIEAKAFTSVAEAERWLTGK